MTGPSQTAPRPRAPVARAVVAGLLMGALLACAAEITRMILQRNTHVVVPGRVYRTAQLRQDQLEDFVRRHDVKTVISLRGRSTEAWYQGECQATQATGVSQEDVTLSANHLPNPNEIRRLIEIFDRSEHPLLIHCQQGADRTGLASAMYQLLYTDASYADARRECSPRFGHVRIHTTAAMDEFFDQYEEWLAARGEHHSPAVFRTWATRWYCPGPYRCRLELVGPLNPPAGRPFCFTVRAENTSIEPWHLKAGSEAGIFAWFVVQDPAAQPVTGDRAGFFDRTVAPFESVELQLPVPALAAGRHRLFVDLMARNVSFTQYGSEALIYDWDARDPAP